MISNNISTHFYQKQFITDFSEQNDDVSASAFLLKLPQIDEKLSLSKSNDTVKFLKTSIEPFVGVTHEFNS